MAGTATLTNTIRWPGPNGKLVETYYFQYDAGTTVTIPSKLSRVESFNFGQLGDPAGSVRMPTLNHAVEGGTTQANFAISVPTTGLLAVTGGTTVSTYFLELHGT